MSPSINVSQTLYSRLAKHSVGFDTPANVIERLLNHFEGEPQSVVTPVPEQVDAIKKSIERDRGSSGKDHTRFIFNGKQLAKARLVLAVVRQYIEDHPEVTLLELEDVFPKHLQGSIGVFNLTNRVTDRYKDQTNKRHFVKDDESIRLSDDNVISVCTQWGKGLNFEEFRAKALELGYRVDPVET